MGKSKAGIIAVWLVSVLLAALFVLAGLPKVTQQPVWIDKFAGWGYAKWFLVIIGGMEVVGAIGLLVPRISFAAATGLGVIMLGAGYTHLDNGEGGEVIRPLVFLALLALVGWLRRPRRTAPAES